MTTIAYKDGVIAGDRSSWSADMNTGQVTKIAVSPKGHLFGSCGGCLWGQQMQEWVRNGAKPKKMPPGEDGSTGLLVEPNGTVWVVERGGMVLIETGIIAVGSGREGAMGAMLAGADAATAIKIASRLDPWTGDAVQWFSAQGGKGSTPLNTK